MFADDWDNLSNIAPYTQEDLGKDKDYGAYAVYTKGPSPSLKVYDGSGQEIPINNEGIDATR